MGWIEMNEKTKKAQKTKAASLADRYSFGHKALSVVLSVVLLGFGWPAVNPAEVFANDDSAAQSEVAQTQESATGATDVSAAQPAVPASSEQAVEASSANQAADANTAASTSAAAASEQPATQPSQPSANKAASADAAAQVKSEYDIALELNNASIKKADGTDAVISLPATKVTVPSGNDFKFTVVPDNGYKLNRVLVNVGGQQSPLAADDAGVYTIEASAFEAGVTITLETEKDAVTASVENAVSIDEPVTQESNAAKAVSDGPISGPNVVAQGDSITLTYNGDMKIDNWYGDTGLFPGWEVSADKKTLKLTATSNWAFIGSSKPTTISLGYIDGQGVWHNQGDDCFKFNVTVKKRSFTVVQPAAKSVGDDCFWIPQIKDNETGKIIDLMRDAPSGSFYPFEYYRDGVKLNASQYWHNPDDFKQPGNYTVKIKPDKGWIYDLGDQSEIVIPIPTQKPDDETFEITGPDTVEQFKNIILKTNADTDVTWTSSDPSIATIDASGKVTGVAEGKVTITATAIAADGKVLTATHDVTVTKSTAQTNSAKLFFLKGPTSNPDSNSARDWFPTGGSSNLNVKVNVDGAVFSGKNTWDNVANRVVSWPDGSTGTTWTLPRANSYWSQVFNNYKNEIQNKLHVSITEDDVEAIVLHPYKISKNSGVYHLDCKVEIKVKQVVTATFWIQSPGATGFDEQYSVSTLEVKDGVAQVVAPEAPEAEKTVDGTKYKFMGWYSDEACTQAVTFPITTSENVFYYGKYVPCDQSIQVNYYLEGTTKPVAPSKTLTGYMKGQRVTQEPIAIPGYTPVSGEAKMGVVGTDASIDFFYRANIVKYRVEYYWNGSDKPFETDKASDKCGDTISGIAPKSFSGYTAVNPNPKSLTLSGDEDKNVVKFYYYKNVTLTANSDTKTYNGSEQSVDGYTTNLREGTIASFDGVTLNGGKGTNAGDYAYTFADGTVGKVSTDNNYIVTELNPGNLHISPVKNEVTITIAGHKGGEKYNGDEQTVEGYDVSDLPSGVSKDDIASNGSAEVKAADAGTYPMNLNEKQFSLTGDAAKNYTNVKFVVTDGELKIDKRAVTLTSEDGHKNYDGKTLQRRTNLKVGGDGFVGNDGVLAKDKLTWYDENNILPGTYENEFEPAYTEGTNLDNYEVTLKFGELVVNARSDKDKYQITVTAKSDTKPYNGNVYTVSGVADTTFTNDKGATFIVEGLSASVSATDAGEYDNKVVGTAVVKDAQGNDVTSQFNVTTVDGKLVINKRNVVLVSESHGFTYDGLDHDWQKVNVDPNSDGFVNGESVAYKDFASIKDVGTKDNSFDFDWSNAKEQNYNITKRYGSLAVSAGDINKYVTLNTTDVEETYNGEHHIAGEATAIDQNGNSLVVEYQKSDGNWTTDRNEVYAVNVGEYGIVNVRVSSPANYGEGSYVTGTERLVVKPIDIELTAKSDNKPYSGTALTNNGYDITNGAFVGDEGLDSVTVSGSQLEVGSSSNVIDAYRLKGNTKAENYNITPKPGTLEVTASHAVVVVKIEGNKDSQKYSGVEQSVSGYKVTGVTVDGQESTLYPAAETDFTFSGAATAARTDAGTTQMGLSAEQFKNANKNFSNVTFEVEDGSMTVTKRAVTLTSATDKKTYDGDALTNDTVTVSGDGFVDGQGFTANVTGSQTNAGSSDNTFTYELTGGATEGENGNYTIAKSEGKLTVDPITAPVTITIAGKTATGTYNGKELTAEGYTFASDNTYYTQDKVAFSGDSKVARTDAGKTEMGLPGKFANADTTNFTNVTFVVTDGHVDIAKADVTLKSADLTKPYDGTALTNKNGGETETPLATESGFAEGEGATYSFSGSQTVVGSSANAFNYTLNEGTKAENYNITVTPGTLTVTNRDAKYQITVKANSDTATYDGKQHSATGIETNEFTTVERNTYTVSGLTTENPVKTNAGTYPNNITGTAVVTDANGNDVSDQFEVTTKNGSLVIDRAAVTMKSASDEWTYDGNEHAKQDMEFVNGFAEGEGATFAYTGAITNVGEAENTYTYTLNANTSADNYTFAEPEYGTLKVNPVTDKVTVTIKGKQDTKSYNGSTQFVTGYDFSTNNSLYAQTNVKFTGDATAKGIAVGSYNMNLAKEQFSNTNENFSNVEFVVEDGWLKIDGGEIDQNGVSWNTHDNQKVYEGTPLAAYAATATDKHGNALNVEYSIDGKTWTSDPSQITITHFGYQVVQLRATGSNYAEGQYATSFEGIAITKRLVTLTSEGGNKPYDGTPLTNGTVTATAKGKGVGFIDGEGVSFNVTGSQTEKGESDNTFDYTFNEGTSAADYWVTPKYGKLIVTADENEVVVTIAENGGNVEYDGTEKSVSGYKFSASNELYKKSDFIFSGNDTVKGTNVGTYDMELKPSDFTNNNQNFSKVTFVVVDGRLNITPKDIKTGENMTVEAPANVTYNGQPQQEEPVVKDGDKTLAKNVDYTLSYSKDTTNVGTVTVTVTGKGNYSGSADVEYQILKRSVVLESATDSKPYDGTALTRPNVTVTGDGFVEGEVTNVRATGSVTTVAEGEVVNTIVYDEGVNFKAGNYDITKKEGKLSITALSAEDGLVITPNNVEYTYNAESHSAGLASASASVAGVNVSLEYRVKGSPDAEWRSNVSEITAINAGTVTIEVRASADNYSGYKYAEQTLTINKRDVELTSASATKVYDGTALTKDWVDMGPNRADTGFIWTDLADDGQVHATGSQTVVGKSENTISYKLKAGAASNYNIIGEHLGTLEVTEQSIVSDPKNPESYTGVTMSNPSDSVYNGEEHKWTPEVKDAKGNVLVEGADYTVSYDTDNFTDAKTIKVTITGTGNYTGVATKTYKITPAPLKVIADSASKPYDGKPLTAGGVIEGLVDGETATAQTEGSQTEVGSSVNTAKESIEWGAATNKDNYYIQSLTDGKLTVTAKSIMPTDDNGMSVSSPSDVTYNGADQTWTPVVKDGDKELSADDYTVSYSTEDRTNVTGVITVTIMGKGNYTGAIEKNYQVLPKGYSVTTATGSKVYDGKPLKGAELEGNAVDGLVDSSDATFAVTGSQTEVGGDAKNNTYELTFSSEQMAKNYTLASEQLGTLTVTENADEIVVTTTGGEFTYDGQAHGATVSVSELPEGYTLERAESSAMATDVTTDDVIADADTLVIKNAQGEDVTNKLNIKKIPGTIKVTPATLTVTTYGAKAEYNGNALTADGTIEGFVNNETVTFATTGSQTYVGESDNTYSIAWDGTAKESNYTVAPIIGKLKVTDNIDNSKVINKGHESGTYDLGATVNFAITAKNVYDTPQTMTISEIEGVTLDQSVFKNVAPGASIEAHATYTITEADLLAGTFVNTATVTFGNGKSYKNTDEVDVAKLNAHLSVVKATTSTPANGSAYQLGETIEYAVTVTNDGNLTANDVAVSDELAGVQLAEGQNANVGTLAPGASATVNYVYTVTEADVLAGNVRNNATATGTPNGGGTLDVTPGTTTDPTGPAAGHITVVKTTTSTPENGKAYQLGEKIVYSIHVVNDGNLTASNVKVSDANADNFGEKVIESLAPGASEDFEATHTVTEADVLAGTVTNVATAKGTSPDPNAPEVPVTPGTKDEPTDTPNAHITIVKHAEQNGSGEAGAFKLGETIEYAITVTNTGNLTATGVKVSDANADNFGEKTIESLAPGASETFTASHTVTEADVLAGKVNNVATAKGTSPDPTAPEVPVTPGEDTKIVDPVNTTLTVAKQAAAPANGEAYQLGEEVVYTISVTNSGNVAYSNVKVSDAQTGLNEVIGTLAVGETKTYEAKHVITEQDIVAGVYVNTATAKADPIFDGNGASHTPQGEATETIGANTDKPLVPGSANLAVEKVVTNEGTGESGAFKLGDTIEYKITVTNNGTLTAKGFKVIDNNADGFEPVTIDELAPGATTDAISAKHVVTSDDILAGSVFNVATTAGGTTPDPKVDPEPTPGENDQPVDAVNATLNVEKTAAASASGSYKLGEGVVYTIKVTNNGNVPYENVKVADGQTGLNETIDMLAVGETRTFTTTHVVDEADIIAGSYTNVATATADPIHDPKTGADVTPQGSDDETIGANTDRPIEPSNPALRITKTSDVAAGTLLKEGDAVTYTVTVENTGNLTLTNVKAADNLAGATLAPGQSDTRAELAPGEQFSVNYVYEVTQADVVAGSVHNEATASGVSPDPNKPVDPGAPGTKDDPTETAKPSLSIQKSNNGSADVAAGSTVSYTITATNNGNVDLTGVVVTDELTGFTSDAFDLAKGESRTFDTSYTVQESDIVNGSIVNVAKGEGTDPKGGTVTDEGSATTTTEAMNGALIVEKKAEAGVYGTGDTVNYAIAVSNTGNVALSNVKVVDAKTGLDETCDLAVGETKTFTTSYTVTMEDVAAGTLANVATATGSDPKGNPVTGSDTETIGNTPQPNPSEPDGPSLKRAFEAQTPSDVVYNGASQQQKPVVKDGETTLSEGTDYELSYSADTTNAGTVTVTVKGKGNYEGSVDVTYQILKKAVKLVSSDLTKPYDGTPLVNGDVALATNDGFVDGQGVNLTFTGSRTDEGTTLQGNTFTWEAKPGTNLDNYAIEAAFGSLTVTPKSIVPGDANGMKVSAPSDKVYTGAEQKFVPVVTDGEKTLVEGVDYAVSYAGANGEAKADFTNVTGSITVTITGMGNYAGSVAQSYQITPKPYTVVTAAATKVYNGTGIVGADLEGSAVDGLVSDSDAAFVVTGEQPGVGSSTNTYELTFASEQMAKNYTLASEQLGTLTVTENADEIVVTTTGGTFAYDGQAHGATVSVSELPEGYTLEKAESNASATNVADGTVVATADTLVIRNAQGKDVTNELKIRKIDGEIQVTPAPLSVETGSATKTYDGSALTNATLKVDGLVAGDVVTGRTTGSQTEVGSSANTYTLTWGEVDPANYEITEQLGVLTVEAAVAPVAPGPQQPSGPVVVPPTATEPAGPADVVADALEGAYETVTGDKATEEQIYDSENPLGKEQAAHCCVHWYMILVMILTALYGVAVWLRRGNHTRKLKNDMNNILGGGDDGKDPSGSPVATNHPAGMEA
ncbi:DUF7507 domain-containing protein [Slackia isoflavoniconvertens]|nr:Ig-like domain-containing protein [Slackia isoflavoniconvertens]MBB3279254.1 putative repeat protein (TIGR01451 family) [Slackia isoflavoniconvertens]